MIVAMSMGCGATWRAGVLGLARGEEGRDLPVTAGETVTEETGGRVPRIPSLAMRYYLFLPGGFPEYVREDNEERMEQLQRHPLLGVYEDELLALAAYETEKRAALERIRRNGRPNLSAEERRRFVTIH